MLRLINHVSIVINTEYLVFVISGVCYRSYCFFLYFSLGTSTGVFVFLLID